MNADLYEPKSPEQLSDGATHVILLTWLEMFELQAHLHVIPAGPERERAFLREMERLGCATDLDLPGELDMTVTDGGFSAEPPARIMTVAEYREYWTRTQAEIAQP